MLDFLGRLFAKPFPSFELFRDNLGNFEIFYPHGWRYDDNIAIEDGKYTISFASGDGRSQFTVSVDVKLPDRFDFARYAKAELESPTAGIYAPPSRSSFRKMKAYARDFMFEAGGRRYFGGGLMFSTGKEVFSMNWSAPERGREMSQRIFDHMLESLVIRKAKRKRPKGGTSGYSGIAE